MVTKKVADPVAPVRDDTGEEAIPANPLIDDSLAQTLENAKAVVWFVRDWSARGQVSAENEETNFGLDFVLAMVDDALGYAAARAPGHPLLPLLHPLGDHEEKAA